MRRIAHRLSKTSLKNQNRLFWTLKVNKEEKRTETHNNQPASEGSIRALLNTENFKELNINIYRPSYSPEYLRGSIELKFIEDPDSNVVLNSRNYDLTKLKFEKMDDIIAYVLKDIYDLLKTK
jgi:hypothetical protein